MKFNERQTIYATTNRTGGFADVVIEWGRHTGLIQRLRINLDGTGSGYETFTVEHTGDAYVTGTMHDGTKCPETGFVSEYNDV